MTHKIYPYRRLGAWSSGHTFYYAFAYRCYNEYCLLLKKIEDKEISLNIEHNDLDPEELASLILFETRDLSSDAYRAAISSVLYGCMSIEAFLNHYGVKRLGEPFYKRFFERLGITEKLLAIIATCHQQAIELDSLILKKIRKLFDERNGLMHPKSREIHSDRVDEFIHKHPKDLQLESFLDDMEIIIDEFCKLDNDIDREFEFSKQT